MAHARTWALVSNGVRARILRDLEDGDGEDPVELVSKSQARHLRDLLTDTPDAARFSIDDARRLASEEGSKAIRQDTEDFARELISMLEAHRRAGEFTSLALFASLPMLNILRTEMPATLRATIATAEQVNLTHLSPSELRQAIRRRLKPRETT